MQICFCAFFTQKSMRKRKIEQGNECFGWQQVLTNSIVHFISHEKKIRCQWLVTAKNLQSIETFLTLKLSQYSKSCSTFVSSEPVTARLSQQRLALTWKRPAFVIARQTRTLSDPHWRRTSCAGALPQEVSHWFCSQKLQLSSGITCGSGIWPAGPVQGFKLGLNLELCCLANEL